MVSNPCKNFFAMSQPQIPTVQIIEKITALQLKFELYYSKNLGITGSLLQVCHKHNAFKKQWFVFWILRNANTRTLKSLKKGCVFCKQYEKMRKLCEKLRNNSSIIWKKNQKQNGSKIEKRDSQKVYTISYKKRVRVFSIHQVESC